MDRLLLTLAAAALLAGQAPLCAQEPPPLSVGEPILHGKDAEDPIKKSRTPPPVRQQIVPNTYTEEKYFTVAIPLGWARKKSSFAEASRKKKVYGTEILGPAGAGGLASRISVFYYSPDSRLQKTPEEFVDSFSKPPAEAADKDGEYGKVREDEVAGYPARLFDRIVFQLVPPTGKKRKKIPVYEYFAVVPAKAGFFVLKYCAPKDIAKTGVKAFEGVLDRCTVMQHIGVLERAGLVIARREGRTRWNHLNAAPFKDIYDRWISPYSHEAVELLGRLKRDLEGA